MSESTVNQEPFSDDNGHPPSKRIKLDSPQPDQENSCAPNPLNHGAENVQNQEDGSGKMFKSEEEEEERKRRVAERRKTIEAELGSKDNKDEEGDDDELASVDDSEEDPADADETENVRLNKNSKKKKRNPNLRRKIKDILKPDQLDDLTLAARKEEEERRQRMQLKLQQLQQQQLQILQQQQSQLLRESLTSTSIPPFASLRGPFHEGHSAQYSDDQIKKLIRKKHITVSLDGSDATKQYQANDDDCILLSSDEELEPPYNMTLPQFPQLSLPVPPHPNYQFRSESKESKKLVANEVIALSSGEEDDLDKMAPKPSHVTQRPIVTENRPVKEVVESDDDCVIISPDPEEEEEPEEKDECSQDLLNVPDALGRVLVNVGHPDEDENLFLAPQIAKIVKPHQIGGIRFLYDNVVESRERYNQSAGFGCILAHAMGLGKTLQTVSFCDVLLRTVGKTVLIIVPINTIQNWLNEFNRYLPAEREKPPKEHSNLKKKSLKAKLMKKEEHSGTVHQEGTTSTETGKLSPQLTQDTSSRCGFDSTFHPATDPINDENEESPSLASAPSPSSQQQREQSTLSSPHPSPEEGIQYRNFQVYLLNETVKSLQARERTITNWTKEGGVLLIGYEMYRMLALKRPKKSTRKAVVIEHEERMAEAESLDRIYECLVDPGPDCVICDEGHRIKNSGAGISQALKAIKTRRRVVLTGYPLQNNLMEYWCMVDFVRPNYLGTKAEFSNMFERPIQNGQCADSTYEDKRLMKYRSHVLHSLLEGFVQRRSHLVLKNALPQKEEWVFLVRLTPVQLKIYKEFIRYLRDDLESDNASANPIKAFAVCCKIWNHPDVLWNVVKKNLDLEMDLDLDEVSPVSKTNKPRRGTGRPRGRPPLNGISLSTAQGCVDPYDTVMPPNPLGESCSTKSETSGISLEWAKPLFENYTPEVMENGVKFEILFQLIQATVAVDDKLLVFSQSLLTLDLIELFLKRKFDWRKHVDYVRLDGSTAGLEREKIINEFNRNNMQKVFLISTRAGSLGINLVGANRVCIFDASWNPCHDSQAVCRVYRYGQTKPCHIYRFVSDCTLEKRIYDRQVSKKGMADRIVDEMNPNTPFKSKDVSSFLVLQHDLLEKLPFIKYDVTPGKFSDPVILSILTKMEDKITQEPFEHESLLIDQKHQRLSKSEKRLALKNYEKEKSTVANAYATYSRPSYAQYYSAINASTSYSSSSSYTSYSSPSTIPRYDQHRSVSTSPNKGMSSSSSRYGASSSPTNSYSGSMGNASFDRFELHINALKTRGISVFPVELHTDTTLKDPSGSQNMFLRAGEKVYILVSQKGTYLRVQGKLLRVPFVGTEMNQEQAEHFVMSLLQIPSTNDIRSRQHSLTYPVEQQLPPSNSMVFQKNPNHLQIANSNSNTGGDVMMSSSAPGSSWNTGGDSNGQQLAQQSLPDSSDILSSQLSSYMIDGYPFQGKPDTSSSNNMSMSRHPSAQTDLQSLSRLTESFCQRSSPYGSDPKQWPPHALSGTQESMAVPSPPVDLEVIKLRHAHSSSSSSNSSTSRTNSPYNRQNWNNNNKCSEAAVGAWGTTEDPSFYTDFTITPVNLANNNGSRRQSQSLENNGLGCSSSTDSFRSQQPSSSREMYQQPETVEPRFNFDSAIRNAFDKSLIPEMNTQRTELSPSASATCTNMSRVSTCENTFQNLIDKNATFLNSLTFQGESRNNF